MESGQSGKKWLALGIKTELSWYCLFLKLDRREKKPQNRFEIVFLLLNVFCRYDLKTKEMKLSQGSTKCGFLFKTMFNLTIYTTKSRLLKFHNCNHQNRICRTTHTLSTDCGKKGLSKPFGPVVREEQCATEALEASYSKTSAVSSIAFARSIFFSIVCLFSSWEVFMRSNCNPFQSRILNFSYVFVKSSPLFGLIWLKLQILRGLISFEISMIEKSLINFHPRDTREFFDFIICDSYLLNNL